MVDRILVANRGEIAVRVVRACHRLGRTAVVVHSAGDAGSLAVALADGAAALDGDGASATYLDIDQVVGAAVASGCDAVHPGYGFLAERAEFADAVVAAGLTFIGPPADVIAAMGDKLAARRAAEAADVPVVPGLTIAVDDPAAVVDVGERLGWPLAIKAVHGGGGRGMRVVDDPSDVEAALDAARREATSAFGRSEVYLERYLPWPRHVEVQIMGDLHGSIVAVGDRDCSVQRRYQKLVEEAPAPGLSADLRRRLADAAVRLGAAVGYASAGTVEFLVQDDELYFLEMNTRIQVEHPVTEMVTGIDLVAEQLRVAAGEPLSFGAGDVVPDGAAIEVRINAEDPAGGRFAPAPGRLLAFDLPSGPGVRVDTGFRAGDVVSPQYDNLLAKVVAWGVDRDEACRRAIEALGELRVEGVPTTAPVAAAVLASDDFLALRHSTRWLEAHVDELAPALPPPVAESSSPGSPIERDGEVEVLGRWYRIPRFGPSATTEAQPPSGAGGPSVRSATTARRARPGSGRVVAPMQGTVIAVDVAVGDVVEVGRRLVVLEAMKMENALAATIDGVVDAVHVNPGDAVAAGALLVEITAGSDGG